MQTPLIALILIAVISTCASGAQTKGDSAPALFDVTTTAELLKAVAKLPASGGAIRLAPGTYIIDKTIEITGKNLVTIQGSGWSTTIKKRGAGDAIRFTNSHFCAVKDLLISGDPSSANGSGIVFKDASSCTVNYCRICEFPVSGIRFEGNPKSPMSSNTVSNCHFIGNRQEQLYSFNNNDFYITGNQFGTHSAYPRAGCVLDHSSAGTYSMNYHWGNVNALRLGPGANFNRIENNRFEQSRETGIIIGDPRGGDWCMLNIITGNTIHTNSEGASGIYPAVIAYDAHDTTFCANQIFSWNSDAIKHKSSLILDRNCAHWIVKDNIFRHNTAKPLVYDENAGHLVKDNIMD